jgi:hypothetical protein
MDFELPKIVGCDECGGKARVRAVGRIEYDWPKTATVAQTATMPLISSARLTVDCPRCGVKTQDYFPAQAAEAPRRASAESPKAYVKPRPFNVQVRKPK